MKSPETLRLKPPGVPTATETRVRSPARRPQRPPPVPPTPAGTHGSASRPPCAPSLLQAPGLRRLPQEALLCCPAARTRFLRAPCAPLPFAPGVGGWPSTA